MHIINTVIDTHCDYCECDASAVVIDEHSSTVFLELQCCQREIEMPSSEFNEFLRD